MNQQHKFVLKNKTKKGFTLIEMLVAMTILLSVLLTANWAYQFFSQYWHGRLGRFDQVLTESKSLWQIKQSVESALPFIVYDQEKVGFYFLGREEGLTFVSSAPIFARAGIDSAVVRLFREATTTGWQLVYEEAPLTKELLIDMNQTLHFSHRLTILQSHNKLAFDYFGYPDRATKFNNQVAKRIATWKTTFDGATTDLQPEQVRLWLGEDYLLFTLPSGHQKLLNSYFEA